MHNHFQKSILQMIFKVLFIVLLGMMLNFDLLNCLNCGFEKTKLFNYSTIIALMFH